MTTIETKNVTVGAIVVAAVLLPTEASTHSTEVDDFIDDMSDEPLDETPAGRRCACACP